LGAFLKLLNFMEHTSLNIDTMVDGQAASCGALMSLSGKRRFMRPYSMLLVHQHSRGFEEGRLTDDTLQRVAQMSSATYKTIRSVILSRSKIDASALDKLLRRDIWLTAKQSKAYGFIDDIVAPPAKRPPVNIDGLKLRHNKMNQVDVKGSAIAAVRLINAVNQLATTQYEPNVMVLNIESRVGLETLLAVYGAVQASPLPVVAVATDHVRNYGAMILFSCDLRALHKYAHIELDFRSIVGPRPNDADRVADTRLYTTLVSRLLRKHTKLNEKDIVSLMSSPRIFTADEAIKLGMIDKIV
jgi:ATP-dependent protease ClpP protease subunit